MTGLAEKSSRIKIIISHCGWRFTFYYQQSWQFIENYDWASTTVIKKRTSAQEQAQKLLSNECEIKITRARIYYILLSQGSTTHIKYT
jgi:hypothetical protein